MALSIVYLVLNFVDGSGDPVTQGTCAFTPNSILTDITDGHIIITRKPVVVDLADTPVIVPLIATDDASVGPPGWSWLIAPCFPGAPPAQQYLIPATGGTTQYLSDLIPSTTLTASVTPIPQSQNVTSVISTFQTLFQVQSSGGTDPVGPFGLVTGALGGLPLNNILGQAYWLGYNPLQLASGTGGTNGAMGASFFTDAGDTNVGGKHGLEANWGCFLTPDSTKATNALVVVAVNDNTNTLSATMHHGAGTGSQIAFQDSPGTSTYATMSATAVNGSPGTRFNQQIMVAGASGIFTVQALTSGGNAEMILNAGASGVAELLFQAGSSTAWNVATIGTTEMVFLDSSSNLHITMLKGATAAAALTEFRSVVKADSSLVVGTAALATTATDGFIYAPSCAGTPTGTPTAQTGTVPVLIDTTAGKLWADIGGTWKSVTLT